MHYVLPLERHSNNEELMPGEIFQLLNIEVMSDPVWPPAVQVNLQLEGLSCSQEGV